MYEVYVIDFQNNSSSLTSVIGLATFNLKTGTKSEVGSTSQWVLGFDYSYPDLEKN